MAIEQQLLDLKVKGDKLNTLRIENSTRLKGLEEEKEKLLIECQELGIDPQKIEEILKQEEASIIQEVAGLETELSRILDEISKI